MAKKRIMLVLTTLLLVFACAFAVACGKDEVKKFTVSFDSAGGSAVQEQTVEKGDFAEDPGAPTKVGYTFGGWKLDGESFVFESTKIEKDITLTAAWTANTDTKYFVTVKLDGEDKTADLAEDFGLTASDGKYYLTGTTDTDADISTLAEQKAPAGTTLLDSSVLKGKIAGDGSLALTVEYKTNEYIVTFETGSSASVAPQTVKHGQCAEDPAYVKAGYTIKWQKDGQDFDFKTPITEDTTLTLVETPNTDTKYYVTVKVDGADKTADFAKAFGLTEADGKYYLTGTTDTNADITSDANDNLPVGHSLVDTSVLSGKIAGDESLALTVEYAANTYTISFNAGGGSGTMEEMTLSYGETQTLTPNQFTKQMYLFDGWMCGEVKYTDEQQIKNLTEENGKHFEFVAIWKEDMLRAKHEGALFTNKESGLMDKPFAYEIAKTDVNPGTAYTYLQSNVFDSIGEGDTLTMTLIFNVVDAEGAPRTGWVLEFFAVTDGGSQPNRLAASLREGTKDENGVLIQNVAYSEDSESSKYSITFDEWEAQRIKTAGGIKFRINTAFTGQRNSYLTVYDLTVNKNLPTGDLFDFETDDYSFGCAGNQAGAYWSPAEEANPYKDRPTSRSYFVKGAKDHNDSYFVARNFALLKKYFEKGDTLSIDLYFFDRWEAGGALGSGIPKNFEVEFYAWVQGGAYGEQTPVAVFTPESEGWFYYARWYTVNFDAEASLAIANAGGFAMRIKIADSFADKSYELRVDNLALHYGNETVEIASSAETIEADIAANVAERFAGYYTQVISVQENEGAYDAVVKISKDGYKDEIINIKYTLAA